MCQKTAFKDYHFICYNDIKNYLKNEVILKNLYSHCDTYLLTYSIEQSPSREANRSSVSQEILRILCTQVVRYRIHKCPPSVPILS